MDPLIGNANRGSISTGPYEIANSCRFDNAWHANTDSMVRETGTPSDQTRWPLSCWVKMSNATFGNRKHGTLNIAGANTGSPERSLGIKNESLPIILGAIFAPE